MAKICIGWSFGAGVDAVASLVLSPRSPSLILPDIRTILFLSAYLEEETAKEEAKQKRRLAEASARWRQLLKSVWMRRQMRDKYSAAPSTGMPPPSSSRAGSEEVKGRAAATLKKQPQSPPPSQPMSMCVDNMCVCCGKRAGKRAVDVADEDADREVEPPGSNQNKQMSGRDSTHKADVGQPGENIAEAASPSLLKGKGQSNKASCSNEPHVHSFPDHLQSYDEETGVTRKECPCGFSLEVEEL
eukprot:587964-Prorocentrum_minimum.AAC.3